MLNLGRGVLHPTSKRSMVLAAQRWGAEFSEVTQSLDPGVHPYWQKLLLHNLFPIGSRVLQLDADMVVAGCCPSPFDLVDPDRFGAVNVAQPGCSPFRNRRADAVSTWRKRIGCARRVSDHDYLNAGLMLYSVDTHTELFKATYSCGGTFGYPRHGYPEQSALSVQLKRMRTPVTWMPHDFNRVTRRSPTPRAPLGFIEHFVGGRKFERIAPICLTSPCEEAPQRSRT